MPGEVYLVGAGPGDKNLITVAGKKAIEDADVILYDRLINDQLLDWAKTDAELIYVGKKPGDHSFTQQQINQMLIDKARAGSSVVRLKGGDPFIFGRGGEESLILSECGIDYEIIPGITSAVGASAYTGIPLTHRNVSSSVIFLTGHRVDSIDWPALRAADTIVIFMGVGNLSEIVDRLKQTGLRPDTAVAMVHWATTEKQITITGTLQNIACRAEGRITPPALIIIGDTVEFREKLKWFTSRPLFGKRILLTRPESKTGQFKQALCRAGAEVVNIPAIKIEPRPQKLNDYLKKIDEYEWLAFTSSAAVQIFFDHLWECGKDARHLSDAKIAVVGDKTAEMCEKNRLQVDLVPEEFSGEGMLKKFQERDITGQNVLLLRAEQARAQLPVGLRGTGARVDDVSIYSVVKTNRAELAEQLQNRHFDMIVFTSPLTVECVFESLQQRYEQVLSEVDLACIGPVTGRKISSFGLTPTITPDEYNLEHLFAAIKMHFGGGE